MQIKRFEAKDMTSALRMVKNELGSNAVILSARSLKKENKLLGLVKSVGVEVTAAVDTNDIAPQAKPVAYAGALSAYRRYEHNDRSMRQDARPSLASRLKTRHDGKKIDTSYNKTSAGTNDVLNCVFEHLLSQEVKRDLADDITADLNQRYIDHQWETSDELITEIANILQGKSAAAEMPSENQSGPRILVVVGPTGVGKTATIAKLAARYAIEKQQAVALISLDSYRIGAANELKVYTRAMGVPLKTAATPDAFIATVDEVRQSDLILVDTPGLNFANLEEIEALKNCLRSVENLEIHLALSATAKESDLSQTLRGLISLPVTRLIFTKLDESATLGNIINLLSNHPVPLSYLTYGRQVPNAIKTGSLQNLIKKLMGDFTLRKAVSKPQEKNTTADGVAAQIGEHTFVANNNSDVFHCSDCKWTRKIKPKNLITFSTAEAAGLQHFLPCRDCQPEKSKPFGRDMSATRDSVRISNYS